MKKKQKTLFSTLYLLIQRKTLNIIPKLFRTKKRNFKKTIFIIIVGNTRASESTTKDQSSQSLANESHKKKHILHHN